MALISDKVVLNPKATGSLPTGSEGSLSYDSTTDQVKVYGTAWQPIARATAAGGDVTEYSGFKVHTFKASGTFTVSGGNLDGVDILVLGSGGSGGGGSNSNYGSGAGAGGMLWRPAKSLASGSYTVTIGNGGAWSGSAAGNKGTDCSFSGGGYTLTGNAGGAGAGTSGASPAAMTGGCGGGTGRDGGTNAAGASNQTNGQDSSAYAYGYAGGIAGGTGCTSAGGGGGTGQTGKGGGYDCQTARSGTVSEGGYGRNSLSGVSNSQFIDFMWSAQCGTNTSQNGVGGSLVSGLGSKPSDIRLGGGGAGSYEGNATQIAHGGLGGGGRGGSRYPTGPAGGIAGTNALASTGSGGGAGQTYNASGATGGNGAKGVVIIRYVV